MKPYFKAMSRQELRNYIFEHRKDEEAFQIYINRVTAQSGEIYPAPQTIDDLKHFPELLKNNRNKNR